MGQARDTIDRMTECMVNKDMEGLGRVYAADAVVNTPDEGEIKGREQIVEYFRRFVVALPDFTWESVAEYESGDTGIDEGYVVGTNTGPLPTPDGGTIPATGKRVRVRGVDIATVKDGEIVTHNFYFDQVDLLTQLGLAPDLS